MSLVVSGRLNKQVGSELGISEITVKAHRGKMMRKMNAGSLPELVVMAATLCLTPSRSERTRTDAVADDASRYADHAQLRWAWHRFASAGPRRPFTRISAQRP
jgi:hypothetical protein